FAAGKCERSGTHRVAWAAAGDHVGERGLVALDVLRRRPGRLDVLAVDAGLAGPLLARHADADRIANGGAVAVDEIEPPLMGAHHHGAARNARVAERDHLARLAR